MQQPYNPQQILSLATNDLIVYQFLHQWKQGELTWEEGLIGMVIVLHQDNKHVKEKLVSKLETQSPVLIFSKEK